MAGNPYQGNIDSVDPNTPIGQLIRGQVPRSTWRDPLPEETRQAGRELLNDQICQWCGGLHVRACPRVKSLTYHTDGTTVTRVEFWAHGEWPEDAIVWPEELEDTEGGDA